MGRVALVTGGTRGIGAAISKALKAAGYTVAASYARNDVVAKAFTEETGIHTFKWDVSSEEDTARGVAEVIADLGTVEVLVNNAGITRDAMMHKMSSSDWLDVLNTNLNSCFFVSKAVIGGMRDNQFGRIINISSVNGQAGQLGQTNYSAAKAGVFGFTKALALENARKNITANVVAPGYINTEMTKDLPEKVMEKIISKIPVGRLGEPEEIARCVLFLAADEAGFLTGETISVNGGHYME
jgi:acetoacetyl-CoA reductase